MFALLLLSFENTPKLLCEFRYRALRHQSDILAFHLDFSNHFERRTLAAQALVS